MNGIVTLDLGPRGEDDSLDEVTKWTRLPISEPTIKLIREVDTQISDF
jgi:hypothetical protein